MLQTLTVMKLLYFKFLEALNGQIPLIQSDKMGED
jgi:hypothetical protein